ncbi:MAG: hypothetical protein JW893_08640 [Candidatus Omnitrophica bacterium]|nr:hypothetical protein [Candidatus Omnitrophota bacterium]
MGVKIAIAVAFFLSIAALTGSFVLYQALKAEQIRRESLQNEQVVLRKQAAELEKSSELYRSEMERMREQLKTYADTRSQFNRELEGSRIQISNLQKKLKVIEDSGSPQTILGVGAMTNDFPATSNGDDGMNFDSFFESTGAVGNMEIPTTSEVGAGASLPASPQVMTVNRKFNFIVVNIGLQDQLKIGDPLVIERNGDYIGNVQVEKLYDQFAAATILEEIRNYQIKEGDTVRRPS